MTTALSSPTYQIGSWIAGDTGLTLTDQFGTAFIVSQAGTSGIYDGADVVLSQSQIPNGDGAYRADSVRTAATPSLTGTARGTSVAGTVASRRAFVALFQRGRQQTLTITDLDGSILTMTVEQAAKPKATPANGLEFDWQLTLSAADPDKYLPAASSSIGLPTSSGGLDYTGGGHAGLDYTGGGSTGLDYGTVGVSGLIQLTNSGTDVAWPEFTWNAPTDGQTLTNPGVLDLTTTRVLAFNLILNQGDQLKVVTNPHGRSVRLNDVPYRRFMTSGQWFSIPAGSSTTVQFLGASSSTTSQLVATLAPALQ